MTVGTEEWRSLLKPLQVYLPVDVGVVARDVEENTRVLVVEEKQKPAAEVYINSIGMTVAEANPEYSDTDPVYSVVYLESIPEKIDQYTPDMVARDARRQDIPQYDFPEGRLSPCAPDRVTLGAFERGCRE